MNLKFADGGPGTVGMIHNRHPDKANVRRRNLDWPVSNSGCSRRIGQRDPFSTIRFAFDAALIPTVFSLPSKVDAGDMLILTEIRLKPLRNAVVAGAPARVVGAVEGVLRRIFTLVTGGGNAKFPCVAGHELAGLDAAVRQRKLPDAGHRQVPGIMCPERVRRHRLGGRQGQWQGGGRDAPDILRHCGIGAGGNKRSAQQREGLEIHNLFFRLTDNLHHRHGSFLRASENDLRQVCRPRFNFNRAS